MRWPAGVVEQWTETTLETRKVWFTTLDGIADHMDKLIADGEWSPTVEKLPKYAAPPAQGKPRR